jgi:ABC-2 type transport system ATP-binding protein
MLITIEALRLCIGNTPILHDVRLSLDCGEIYGLLGPNGAGKSTTIAAAVGLLRPESGTIAVLGKDPRREPDAIRSQSGILLEQNGFPDWMTAPRYLAFFARLHGRELDANAIGRRLDAVGLQPRAGQTIGTFSRGMRQRLGLARALIGDPTLLILDEPTNGLDPRGRREMHDILLGLAERGVGILLCTHLLDDVERLCRRVGFIVAGRTVAEGAIADLVRSEGRLARFRLRLDGQPSAPIDQVRHVKVIARERDWWVVDLDGATRPEAAWRELLFSGWPIAEIRGDGGGLEELYLALTDRSAA